MTGTSSTSGSSNSSGATTNSNRALRTFTIFNPTFSKGKEERAMDNVIFFHPPTVHPNIQMNTVGFATAVSALLERFTDDAALEMSTDGRNWTLFNPIKDYWLVMETTSIFDASVVKPLLIRAFSAFVFRYGRRAFVKGKEDGQGAIMEFFGNFCKFIDNNVLIASPSTAVAAAAAANTSGGSGGSESPSSKSGASQTVPPTSGDKSPEKMTPRSGVSSLLSSGAAISPITASAEALLHFPIQFSNVASSAMLNVESIVNARLGAFSAKMLAASTGNASSNENVSLDETCTVSLAKLDWLRADYMILSDGFRFLGHRGVVQEVCEALQFVVMVSGSELQPFVCFPSELENIWQREYEDDVEQSATEDTAFMAQPTFCSVSRHGGVTVLLMYDWPRHPELLQLTEDIAKGVSAFCTERPSGGSTDSTSSSHGAAPLPPLVPAGSAFTTAQATFHVIQLNAGISQGALLYTLPRVAHWTLASLMREVQHANCNEVGANAGLSLSLATTCEEAHGRGDSRRALGGFVQESWVPLGADVWLCVSLRGGRIIGIVFHNAHQLSDCFDLGNRVMEKLHNTAAIVKAPTVVATTSASTKRTARATTFANASPSPPRQQ